MHVCSLPLLCLVQSLYAQVSHLNDGYEYLEKLALYKKVVHTEIVQDVRQPIFFSTMVGVDSVGR